MLSLVDSAQWSGVRGLGTKVPLASQECARNIPGSARSQKDYRLNT